MLDRRKFLGVTTVTAAAALASCSQGADTASTAIDLTKRKPVKMHAGTQHWAPTPENLQLVKRHGVDHIAAWPPNGKEETLAEEFARTCELCERHGISLDVVPPPLLDTPPPSAITLGRDPDRGREIEYIDVIGACADSGIQIQHAGPVRRSVRTHPGARRLVLQHLEV